MVQLSFTRNIEPSNWADSDIENSTYQNIASTIMQCELRCAYLYRLRIAVL